VNVRDCPPQREAEEGETLTETLAQAAGNILRLDTINVREKKARRSRIILLWRLVVILMIARIFFRFLKRNINLLSASYPFAGCCQASNYRTL